MNRYGLLIFAFLSLLITSCKDKNAVALKEKLQSICTIRQGGTSVIGQQSAVYADGEIHQSAIYQRP